MVHRFHPSILREYDIRGVVGETLGEDDAYAVGRDGRTTSPMLEDALVRGLAAGGVDVVRIGVGPSPMLYYAEAAGAGGQPVDGGIQVTGSHNPRDHNGFKMVLGHRSFWGADIAA
ncbi:MAG: phosphomannomutase, partial [Sphingomonas sp.]